MDGSSLAQQSSNQDPNSQQPQHNQQYLPPMQSAQLLQQQQQLQQRQQFEQQSVQPVSGMKPPSDVFLCSRRLMQYLYHLQQRPTDNSIAYWRKFVAEYYSPWAKKRWCFSLYENVGHPSLGLFPQSAMDAWHCDICGSKSGRGFEATFEILPRLNEVKFSSGVIDELLFLDFPCEYKHHSGLMMLEYAKAVQESVYEQLRVVQEGQLQIIFTSDLKILSWEFCARRHEVLLPRRLIAPQVNQLLEVVQKCQSTLTESELDGVVSQQDLRENSNMVVTTGCQLAKSLELQSLNELGLPKRYVRCLQTAEVVNSMKNLMDFSSEHKAGPIEGLKSISRHGKAAKFETQNIRQMEQQMGNIHGLTTDRNVLGKLMSMHPLPGINSKINNNQHMGGWGALSGSGQASRALSNFQNSLMRQNSNTNIIQQDASSSRRNSNQYQFSLLQGPNGMLAGTVQNLPVSGLSSTNLQHRQQRLLSSGLLVQNQSQSSASASYFEPSASAGNSDFSKRTPGLPLNMDVSDEMVPDTSHEFTEK